MSFPNSDTRSPISDLAADGTEKYKDFKPDCTSRTYLEGLLGATREPFCRFYNYMSVLSTSPFCPSSSCHACSDGCSSHISFPTVGTDGTRYVFEEREVGIKGSGNFDVGYFQV